MSPKKQKIMDLVGKLVHQHVSTVREASHDFTVLFLKRNGIKVDQDQLAIVLSTVQKALDSEHMNKLDVLVKNLDKELDKILGPEDELDDSE